MPAPIAVELGAVDEVAVEAEVLSTAMARAALLAPKAKPALAGIRHNFYAAAIAALDPAASRNDRG